MFDIATTTNGIINRFNDFDDMFKSMNAMFGDLFDGRKNKGLSFLSRPHNLYTYKDDKGHVVGNKLEVVTTPFKKDEVSVEVQNGILTVKCGNGNKVEDDKDAMVHHGISSQSYTFSLKLADRADIDKIAAKNEDGILTIKIPLKTEEVTEPKKISVL
jgi:HSP20 family molecular chaperone IbpA